MSWQSNALPPLPPAYPYRVSADDMRCKSINKNEENKIIIKNFTNYWEG